MIRNEPGAKGGDHGDDPSTLTVESLAEIEQKLAGLTLNRRARLPGLDARRADTILAGAIVVRTALELCGADEATVCEASLREGIVADYIATHRPGMLLVEEFPDLRRRSVMELCRRCQFDEAHAQHVARLALSLFDQTRELHQANSIDESDAELLEFTALLHDVGFYISPSRHHRHSQYLIQTHDMVGFSQADVDVMGFVARYHRKAEPPREKGKKSGKAARRRQQPFRDLSRRARRRVRFLAALLRLADGLDRTHSRLVRAVRCQVRRKAIELRIEVDGDPELELWAARRKGDLLETLTGRTLRLAVDSVTQSGRAPVDETRKDTKRIATAGAGAGPKKVKKTKMAKLAQSAPKAHLMPVAEALAPPSRPRAIRLVK
jgi:exopolyphosphatase/guanosine-5'-triphosphate,3'-diphosphate pyrophosphatase